MEPLSCHLGCFRELTGYWLALRQLFWPTWRPCNSLQWLKGEQIWDKHNIKHHMWVKTNDIKPFGTVIWHFGMQKGSKEAFSAWNGSLWTPLGCLKSSIWHECWSNGIIPITQTGGGSHQGCVAVVGMGTQEWEGHRDSRGADHLLPTGKWKWSFYHLNLNSHICVLMAS